MVTCELCGRQFKNTQGLRGHKTFVHGDSSSSSVPATQAATEMPLSKLEEKLECVIGLKEAAKVPPENTELLNRKVPFDKLAGRVIEEFAEITHGLVPNVALQSMSEICKNTSKLIKRFSRELDAPYLTHKTLLKNPEEAEEHLVLLITAELSAILEEKDVKTGANIKAIRNWINYKKSRGGKFDVRVNGQKRNGVRKK